MNKGEWVGGNLNRARFVYAQPRFVCGDWVGERDAARGGDDTGGEGGECSPLSVGEGSGVRSVPPLTIFLNGVHWARSPFRNFLFELTTCYPLRLIPASPSR